MRVVRTGLGLVGILLCMSAPVLAADPPSSSAPASPPQAGVLVLEPIRDSFVVTPDVQVTRMDGATRTLVGAYGGWLREDTLLLGGGGYWLADHSGGERMGYGGLVAGWLTGNRRVRLGVRGLIGGGQATLVRTVTYRWPIGYDFDRRIHGMPIGQLINGITTTTFTARARFHQGFVIAEPQAEVVLHLTRWVALNAGAGYRAIGWADGFERQLRGAVGSVGVRIGRSS